MTARRWSDVKAEAMARQPWLASDEAEAERAEIRADNLGRIRGHELAEMRKSCWTDPDRGRRDPRDQPGPDLPDRAWAGRQPGHAAGLRGSARS